ncbi:MAG: ABC transporter ATP-binding protein [Candidatus Magasanikbacteria bacterium]|nr:ABC transporter ATP-binding protein [Candidatus Magasanikbacteria bacterium]
MYKILKYLKPYSWWIVLTILLTFGQVMANLEITMFMAKIIDEGVLKLNSSAIFYNGWIMLLIALVGAVCTILAGFLAAKVSTGFAMRMRKMVFAKVESFSLVEFDNFSTASLITRSTNDIQQMQSLVFTMLRMMLVAPFSGIGALILAYRTAPSMLWLMALAVSVMILIIIVLLLLTVPKFKIVQELTDRINLAARENLTGLRVIRAFNSDTLEEEKFDRANLDLTKINIYLNRLMGLMQPVMTAIFNIMALAIVFIGARLIGSGDLLVGNMIAFMQFAFQVLFSFMILSMVFIIFPRAAVSGKRILEVLETDLSIKETETPLKAPAGICGQVEFKDVTFAYPGAEFPVLQGISFQAKPGQMTAIVGSTGCGKSTLVNLIPRFYDVCYGEVLVDGIDIKDLALKDLNDKIGYVPQKGVLFTGTIESNIRYGEMGASKEELVKAAEIAQAKDFIEKAKKKFQTPISQGGTNVSGGQKQRLSIARALIKQPEIFIFDDSFSALDFKTDATLRQALRQETKNATVLIVAQRISTILNADQIIVLEAGKIVGIGKHGELLKTCSVYKEIALSQLSPEELGDLTK